LTGGVSYMEGVGCGPDGYRKEGGGGKLQLQLEEIAVAIKKRGVPCAFVQLCADVAQLCSVCSESEQTVST
jgi:hypothetical protein